MSIAFLLAVDDSEVNPGLLGFGVVAVLGVATWLLILSMMRHLRRVDAPADDAEGAPADDGGSPPAEPRDGA